MAAAVAAFELPGSQDYTAPMPDERIPLGISTCLLGQNVRYDGGHKLDRFLRDTLGKSVRWIPVCPEVECGLGVPRESMRLASTPPRADRGRGAAALGAVKQEYLAAIMRTLVLEATVKKNVTVLQHAMGYFKKNLTADEKAEILEVIGDYQRGHVPLVVPIVLIRHYVRRFAEPCLSRQIWLNPHPVELCLRNHA